MDHHFTTSVVFMFREHGNGVTNHYLKSGQLEQILVGSIILAASAEQSPKNFCSLNTRYNQVVIGDYNFPFSQASWETYPVDRIAVAHMAYHEAALLIISAKGMGMEQQPELPFGYTERDVGSMLVICDVLIAGKINGYAEQVQKNILHRIEREK